MRGDVVDSGAQDWRAVEQQQIQKSNNNREQHKTNRLFLIGTTNRYRWQTRRGRCRCIERHILAAAHHRLFFGRNAPFGGVQLCDVLLGTLSGQRSGFCASLRLFLSQSKPTQSNFVASNNNRVESLTSRKVDSASSIARRRLRSNRLGSLASRG